MDEQQRTQVFHAQTQNVRELERSWSQINRQINSLILQKNSVAVEINTKVLALIYCALAEALFSKLIHTPDGLTLDEINQVKRVINSQGIKSGWIKCSELAIKRVEGAKSNHGQNVQKNLHNMIDAYIYDPSLIRNKLAHGQWCIALNRENSAINPQISQEIKEHNAVELYRRKHALEKLSVILEDIIESPNKAHHRDYWKHLVDFEDAQRKLAEWTLERKVTQLFEKKSRAPRNT